MGAAFLMSPVCQAEMETCMGETHICYLGMAGEGSLLEGYAGKFVHREGFGKEIFTGRITVACGTVIKAYYMGTGLPHILYTFIASK